MYCTNLSARGIKNSISWKIKWIDMKSVFENDGNGYPHNLHFCHDTKKCILGVPFPSWKLKCFQCNVWIRIRMSFTSYAYFFSVFTSIPNINENHWQKNTCISIKNFNKQKKPFSSLFRELWVSVGWRFRYRTTSWELCVLKYGYFSNDPTLCLENR